METVYIETTIVSYLVAEPSRNLLVAAHQQATRDWWQQRQNDFLCVISAKVIAEASLGDPDQVRRRREVLAALPQLAVTEEARVLAGAFFGNRSSASKSSP